MTCTCEIVCGVSASVCDVVCGVDATMIWEESVCVSVVQYGCECKWAMVSVCAWECGVGVRAV